MFDVKVDIIGDEYCDIPIQFPRKKGKGGLGRFEQWF